MKRWGRTNGYRDVLSISLPLVASMGSITVMQFTDRVFLANYSVEAIAAALPAGIASFTFLCFFMGVGTYTNVFVAQYAGARTFGRVGAALWQGIYFSLISAALLACLVFFSRPLFDLIGHSPNIRDLEVVYFNILTLGAGLVVLDSVLACFYTGRSRTGTVMFVNMAGAAINIPLDYCLINGVGPFPEWGIKGAGIATVTSSLIIVLIFCLLIFHRQNRENFATWRSRVFDPALFKRLMRYGVPSGFQFFLEVFGFTFFVLMVGRLGDLELAASNIALAIASLAFLPMVGLHIGVATLVGQAIGRGMPEDGVYAAHTALHIIMAYMAVISVIFFWMPEPLLSLFQTDQAAALHYEQVEELGVVLLRFVSLFCLFDGLNLVFSGAIKGAGDTRFIMWTIAVLLVGVMIVPLIVALEVLRAGIYVAWTLVTLYICALGMAFYLRYRSGKWKRMRVIEDQALPGAHAGLDPSPQP